MNTLLTAYARAMGETLTLPASSADSVKRQQQWQHALLSSLCRWRSCMCDSSDTSKRSLCQYHTELKHFMDARQKLSKPSLTNMESAKYLPRKPPDLTDEELANIKRSVSRQVAHDLSMIRAASTLLTELWDGSLKETVVSFSKRVCADMGVRNRLEAITQSSSSRRSRARATKAESDASPVKAVVATADASDSITLSCLPPPARPSWFKWADPEALGPVLDKLFAAQNHIDNVLRLEKAISLEIQDLARLGIFPSFEITIIRKDMKRFREVISAVESGEMTEEQEVLDQTEVKLCERKLTLLQARKEDELEIKAKEQRKHARSKQAADSKDANYQMRF